MTYMHMAQMERQAVQRHTLAEIDPRIAVGKVALHYALLALESLEQAVAPRLAIQGAAAGFYDALSDLSGECAKHLDNAGLVEADAAIDLTSLNRFL